MIVSLPQTPRQEQKNSNHKNKFTATWINGWLCMFVGADMSNIFGIDRQTEQQPMWWNREALNVSSIGRHKSQNRVQQKGKNRELDGVVVGCFGNAFTGISLVFLNYRLTYSFGENLSNRYFVITLISSVLSILVHNCTTGLRHKKVLIVTHDKTPV